MPQPIDSRDRYMPGLDGLRAIAVLGVIAYHLGWHWIPGGLLGVGVFFTLSGYLITDILLAQVARGGIRLKPFWLARARRLLPALFVMLVVVIAWVTVIGPHQPSSFRVSVATAVGYFNNWWLIAHDVSYFAQFSAPEPLNHLWSLSIEEQFYIVWPFVLMVGLAIIPGLRTPAEIRPRLGGAILVLALASGVLMAALYHPGADPSRVYYGTDTRALELLIGAALATVWPSRLLRAQISGGARRIIDAGGVLGLAVIGLMFWRSTEFSPFLYRGGFLVLSVATALVVAASAHPASRLGPLLGSAPLRWIGVRSYAIYLWHFPIIVLTTPDNAGPSALRDIAQIAVILIVAALSWRYVENPIRHGALKRLRRPLRLPARGRLALAIGVGVTVVAGAGVAGAGVATGPDDSSANATIDSTFIAPPVNVSAAANSTRSSCTSLIHIGDSTSEGLISHEYLPDPRQRISARYAKAGARVQHYEISGARAIIENYHDQPNAYDVARKWQERGFQGCWVLALGTNEAANVAVGSPTGFDERIARMMDAADGEPVLWVNVKSIRRDGPYSASNLEGWNEALLEACDEYPNMRIYDWASDVHDGWFIDDGIHYTSRGYAQRARLIAAALADAFPSGSTATPDCVVSPRG
jgi:peptidoglycan/LPS O-acetylase OafA/YrhL